MKTINNHKTLTVIVAISAIAAVLTGTVHMALAQVSSTPSTLNPAQGDDKTITKTTTNSGVNVPTDTDQKTNCETAGSASPVTASCTASSSNTITQSGGVLTHTSNNKS